VNEGVGNQEQTSPKAYKGTKKPSQKPTKRHEFRGGKEQKKKVARRGTGEKRRIRPNGGGGETTTIPKGKGKTVAREGGGQGRPSATNGGITHHTEKERRKRQLWLAAPGPTKSGPKRELTTKKNERHHNPAVPIAWTNGATLGAFYKGLALPHTKRRANDWGTTGTLKLPSKNGSQGPPTGRRKERYKQTGFGMGDPSKRERVAYEGREKGRNGGRLVTCAGGNGTIPLQPPTWPPARKKSKRLRGGKIQRNQVRGKDEGKKPTKGSLRAQLHAEDTGLKKRPFQAR